MAAMAAEEAEPVVAEIAQLLDQCSPEELANILAAIESSPPDESLDAALDAATLQREGQAAQVLVPVESQAPQTVAPLQPVPPAAPPPGGNGRRPVHGVKKVEAPSEDQQQQPQQQQQQQQQPPQQLQIGMEDMQALLSQHSSMILAEVQKLIPGAVMQQQQQQHLQQQQQQQLMPANGGVGDSGLDMHMLSRVLVDRDNEVKQLEEHLAELQAMLSSKDKRVSDLGADLDVAVREVRHRQLDLEFQQLKLEERVRCNAELEQRHRMLTAQVEEASLNARHAALDVEMCRASSTTPRGGNSSVRVQGSLPWTLRKNRMGLGMQ